MRTQRPEGMALDLRGSGIFSISSGELSALATQMRPPAEFRFLLGYIVLFQNPHISVTLFELFQLI
jgi:hypothetical protein